MGLFDSIMGGVLGNLGIGGSGDSGGGFAGAALEMLNNVPGGLSGLIGKFNESGLGNIASSWVSTGQNLPISADQITSALGPDMLGGLASKLGIGTGDVAQQLSGLLPGLIDKLTPDGNLPSGVGLLEQAGKLFGGLGGR